MFSSPAFSKEMKVDSKDSYGSAGCGLGSMLFGNQPGAVQVVAATTNGTLGNQTFGITTGTSNCGKGVINTSANPSIIQFVENNMDNLAKEIALGQGESLDTLAELMDIPSEGRSAFNENLQSHYSSIFPNDHVVVAGVVNNIIAVTLAN
ncbi:MAG: DUF3015 family protein [Nitrospirae bacterium]|nr:DUF3015 family protein [Nitrospirota bacterium]